MRAVKAVLGLVVILAAAGGGLYLTERLMAASEPAEAAQGAAAPLRVETITSELVTFADAVTAVGTNGWVKVESPRSRWVNLSSARSVEAAN